MNSDLVNVCIRNKLSPFIINAIAETLQTDSDMEEKETDNKNNFDPIISQVDMTFNKEFCFIQEPSLQREHKISQYHSDKTNKDEVYFVDPKKYLVEENKSTYSIKNQKGNMMFLSVTENDDGTEQIYKLNGKENSVSKLDIDRNVSKHLKENERNTLLQTVLKSNNDEADIVKNISTKVLSAQQSTYCGEKKTIIDGQVLTRTIPLILSEKGSLHLSKDKKLKSFKNGKQIYSTSVLNKINKNDENNYVGTTTSINTNLFNEEEEKSIVKTVSMEWSKYSLVSKKTELQNNESNGTEFMIDDNIPNYLVLNKDHSWIPSIKTVSDYSQPYLFYNSKPSSDKRRIKNNNNLDKYEDGTLSENDETNGTIESNLTIHDKSTKSSESDVATRSISITEEASAPLEGSEIVEQTMRHLQSSLYCQKVPFESNNNQDTNPQEVLADVCAMLSSVCDYLDANEWINNSSKDSCPEIVIINNETPKSMPSINFGGSNMINGKPLIDFDKDSKRTSKNATELDYVTIKKTLGTSNQLITFSKDSINSDTILSSAWKDCSDSTFYCSKNIELNNIRNSSTKLEKMSSTIDENKVNKPTATNINVSTILLDSGADTSLKWEDVPYTINVKTPNDTQCFKNRNDAIKSSKWRDVSTECQTTENIFNSKYPSKESHESSLENLLQESITTELVIDTVDIPIIKTDDELKETLPRNIDLFNDRNGKSMTSSATTINLNSNPSKGNIFSSSLENENVSYAIIHKNIENNQCKILSNSILPTENITERGKFGGHGSIPIDDVREIYMKCTRESSRYGLFEELEAYATKAHESSKKSLKTINSQKNDDDIGIDNIYNSNTTHYFTTKQTSTYEENVEDIDEALKMPFKTDNSFQVKLCVDDNKTILNVKTNEFGGTIENFENPSNEFNLGFDPTSIIPSITKDAMKKIETTTDSMTSNTETQYLKKENDSYRSLNLSKCNLSLNIAKSAEEKYGDIELTHSSEINCGIKSDYDKQNENNDVIDNSSSEQVFLIHEHLDFVKDKYEKANQLPSCFQSAIKILIEHPVSEEAPYTISHSHKVSPANKDLLLEYNTPILPQAKDEFDTSHARESIFKRFVTKPTNISMRNGCYSSYVYEIFDVISRLSERGPADLDNFEYIRNGCKAFRTAFWNLHEMTLEKVRNLGVIEVICSTILENGWSIVAFQEICHPLALNILCNELNSPRLLRTSNFKGINSKCWRFCIDDSINSDMGFIYDAESGGIGMGLIRHIYRTCGGCESSICTFAVGPTYFTVMNTRIVPNAIIKFESRMAELLKDRDEPVLVTGDFENSIGKELNGLNCVTGLTPLIPLSLNTCLHNSRGILHYNDSILVNSSIRTGHFTGSWGIVKVGLSHLCIPDGWEWGGSVSPRCPVWGEFYVLHNNNAKRISHTSINSKIMNRYGYT